MHLIRTKGSLPYRERFHSHGKHLCKYIGTKESVYIRKEVKFPKGYSRYTNMAAVSLFWNTNMAAVTYVKTLYIALKAITVECNASTCEVVPHTCMSYFWQVYLSYAQTDATTPNVRSCWPTMFLPFARDYKFDRFQTSRNNSQLHTATCNRVCKQTQHVTSNNVGSCWPIMLFRLHGALGPVNMKAGNPREWDKPRLRAILQPCRTIVKIKKLLGWHCRVFFALKTCVLSRKTYEKRSFQ